MAMRSTCLVVILLLGTSLSEARKLKQSLSVTTIDSDYKSTPDVKTPPGTFDQGHDLLSSVFGSNVASILGESESVESSGGTFVSTSGNAVASVGAHARGDSVTHSSFVSAGAGKDGQDDDSSVLVIGSGSSSSVSSESSLSTTLQLSDVEDEEEVKENKKSKKSGSKKSDTHSDVTVVPAGNVEASFLVSANGDALAFDGKGPGPVSFSAGITSSSKSKDHDH